MIEYTLEYIKQFEREKKFLADEVPTWYDWAIERWRYRVPIDSNESWYMQVFFKVDGVLDYYSLDEEVAYDSHYSFRISKDDAEKLFGNKETYLHNLMKDFLKSNTGENLKELLEPYILKEYHIIKTVDAPRDFVLLAHIFLEIIIIVIVVFPARIKVKFASFHVHRHIIAHAHMEITI